MTSSTLKVKKGLIACHECDLLHREAPLPKGGEAVCVRCGTLLMRDIPNSIDRILALSYSGLIFFAISNLFPILTLRTGDRISDCTLFSGSMALWEAGMGELGVLFFFTTLLAPLFTFIGLIFIFLPLKFNKTPSYLVPAFKAILAIEPWGMVGVYILAVMVAIVKLVDMATVIYGYALYSWFVLLFITAKVISSLNPKMVWDRVDYSLESTNQASPPS
ncbi:MAG: paraquat-inducible protein A [Magnetococcales bacterium]|nr:paraquat-inducible protein A [Magnetococcales bacterium]